jgi:hypothetical protein
MPRRSRARRAKRKRHTTAIFEQDPVVQSARADRLVAAARERREAKE